MELKIIVDLFGYLAQFLFILASAAQARKSYLEGHSEGVSHGLIWMLTVGFIFMMTYVLYKIGFEPVLMLGYLGQALFCIVIAKYKYFPRKDKQIVVIGGKEIDVTGMEAEAIQKAVQQAWDTGEPSMWIWDEAKGQYVDTKEKA